MGDPFQLGRYSLYAELASGGMATVYLGRLNGPVGFGKTVAIKRLHPHLARDPQFAAMFLDEARLAARVQHPNVVPTLDVVASDSELFLVLEYVRGESLGALLRTLAKDKKTPPMPVIASILIGALNGLHAAHEARDERNEPLGIVHRDVSPQNILVGTDGIARVLDFGVAKAVTRLQTTRDGQLKGKLPYLAPEQLAGETSRATDVYAAGVVLWETLACKRLFSGKTEAEVLNKILTSPVPAPSTLNAQVSADLDRITAKALARDPARRYASALEMASDLDQALRPASTMVVAQWLESVAGPALAERSALVAEVESGSLRAVARPELLKELAASYGAESSNQLPSIPPSAVSAALGTQSTASVASLTYKTPATKPASRLGLWLGLAGTAVGVVGIGLFLSRGNGPGSRPTTASASTMVAASTPMAVSTSTPTSTSNTASSASPDAGTLAATSAVRPTPTVPARRGTGRGGAAPKPTAGSQTGDLDSLLDSH